MKCPRCGSDQLTNREGAATCLACGWTVEQYIQGLVDAVSSMPATDQQIRKRHALVGAGFIQACSYLGFLNSDRRDHWIEQLRALGVSWEEWSGGIAFDLGEVKGRRARE